MRVPFRIALPLIALALVAGEARTAEPTAEAADPAAEVRAAFQPVLAAIDATLADPEATPDQKRALIEHELDIWIDSAAMAESALGARANEFSGLELAAFASEFERYLQHFYISRIALRDESAREAVAARYDARAGSVELTVPGAASVGRVRPGTPRAVDVRFRFRRRYGDWRIVRVAIGEVDVTKLFGEQFESLLRTETPADLIARLRDRNEELEAKNPLAPR